MPDSVSDFAPGELVRVSAEGSYGDRLWAGALAIVINKTSREGRGGPWVRLRRIADGKEGEINAAVVEKPNA